MKAIEIYCDGGARGNPGPSAAAAILREVERRQPPVGEEDQNPRILARVARYLGPNLTNNQAEYHAVIEGLKVAQNYEPERIIVYLDSELLVEQLNLRYKLKNSTLKKLFAQVQVLKLSFPVVEFRYIPRRENQEADRLVHEVLNRELGSRPSAIES